MKTSTFNQPVLQKRIFWDVDFESLDYEEQAQFIITRAFERGDVADIRQVRRFYGDEKVITSLTAVKFLFYHTFVLAKNIFNLDENAFKCFTTNQLSQTPWTY